MDPHVSCILRTCVTCASTFVVEEAQRERERQKRHGQRWKEKESVPHVFRTAQILRISQSSRYTLASCTDLLALHRLQAFLPSHGCFTVGLWFSVLGSVCGVQVENPPFL